MLCGGQPLVSIWVLSAGFIRCYRSTVRPPVSIPHYCPVISISLIIKIANESRPDRQAAPVQGDTTTNTQNTHSTHTAHWRIDQWRRIEQKNDVGIVFLAVADSCFSPSLLAFSALEEPHILRRICRRRRRKIIIIKIIANRNFLILFVRLSGSQAKPPPRTNQPTKQPTVIPFRM